MYDNNTSILIKAHDLITDRHLQDTIIFTDSLSAINNINNTNNPSDIGLHIQNKIYTLQKINNFKSNFSGSLDTPTSLKTSAPA